MRLLLIAIIAFFAISSSTVHAGEWSYQELGPGSVPETVLVEISATADFVNQCRGVNACYLGGGFSIHFSPGPPTQSHSCVDSKFPDGTGVRLISPCVDGAGSVVWEIELARGTSYTLSGGQSSMYWHVTEPGGGCAPYGTCSRVDDDFDSLQIDTSAVPVEAISWSALRSRYLDRELQK